MTQFDPRNLVGARLVGPGEKRIGKIAQVLLDDRTGAPQWVTVRTDAFRRKTRVVPLSGARPASDGGIEVPYSKDQVKDAPSVPVGGGHLREADEASLYRYYGSEHARHGDSHSRSEGPQHLAPSEHEGCGTSGSSTDDAMSRSKPLRAATEPAQVGLEPLRKDDITEQH